MTLAFSLKPRFNEPVVTGLAQVNAERSIKAVEYVGVYDCEGTFSGVESVARQVNPTTSNLVSPSSSRYHNRLVLVPVKFPFLQLFSLIIVMRLTYGVKHDHNEPMVAIWIDRGKQLPASQQASSSRGYTSAVWGVER